MNIKNKLIIAFISSGIIGAITAYFSPGNFFFGWLASFVILFPGLILLITAVAWAGGERRLAAMVSVALFLHLAVGICLHQVLPLFGFDEPQQKAGYVFYDAYRRDAEAWNLAKSSDTILSSFKNEFATDQYGGLLSVSAAIYRYLSPDAQRPVLIILLGTLVTTLGIPFFYKAVRDRWNRSLASLAGWILVLYPDGILFGSSQMREPFLVGLLCIISWGIFAWESRRKMSMIVLPTSFILLGLVSSRVAAAALVACGILFWLENLGQTSDRMRRIGWLGMGIGALLVTVLSWEWLRSSSAWDLLLTERGSGWVTKVIGEAGVQWRIPFIMIYGIVQPVLPAAIADPTLPVWKTIAIFRAAGWYLIAPFLLYGFFSVLKIKERRDKSILFWISLFLMLWITVSSLRAGGDQWDNPRYRSIFLPWMAFVAAWGIRWSIEQRDFWLARMVLIELIFLGFFTNWYFSRYFLLWKRLPFWQNVIWIAGLTGIVLFSGLIWDAINRKLKRPKN